jgi:predicted glycosyltransferase
MKKVLYIVEPMIGIGPNVDANIVAKTAIKSFPGLEMVICMDDQIPLSHMNEKVRWHKTQSWRYDSVNEQIKDLEGNLLSEGFKKKRSDELIELYKDFKPDVILLHNYLSGSKWDRIIDFEILPLIKHAKQDNPNLKVYSFLIGMIDSFEDLSRADEYFFVQSVKKNIDRIFLRSDSTELFFKTCPGARKFKDLFVPVGYSGETEIPVELNKYRGRKEVVVSAGGSDLGYDLFKAAVEAFYLAHETKSQLVKYDWRLFVGPMQEKNKWELEKLNAELLGNNQLPTKLFIEGHISPEGFLSVLCHNCAMSISQCGQRTFTELEIAGVPAVVIPRESKGKEFEQLYRAEYMQKCDRAIMLREKDLSPQKLLIALSRALHNKTVRIGLRLNGVHQMLSMINELY